MLADDARLALRRDLRAHLSACLDDAADFDRWLGKYLTVPLRMQVYLSGPLSSPPGTLPHLTSLRGTAFLLLALSLMCISPHTVSPCLFRPTSSAFRSLPPWLRCGSAAQTHGVLPRRHGHRRAAATVLKNCVGGQRPGEGGVGARAGGPRLGRRGGELRGRRGRRRVRRRRGRRRGARRVAAAVPRGHCAGLRRRVCCPARSAGAEPYPNPFLVPRPSQL